jgi:putative membrane protein
MNVLLENPAPIANLPQLDQLLGALVATGAYGLLGIFLMLVGFKMFEWITGRLDVETQLEKQNIAVGIVVAALLIGISLIVVVSML